MLARRPSRLFFPCAYFLVASSLVAAPPSTTPVEGLRENTPAVHALVNARIVPRAGVVHDSATLVIRDGAIVAVGTDVVVPADARIWNLSGKTIYPGLIDAYSETSAQAPSGGAGYWNSLITPELRVAPQYKPDAESNEKLRKQGFIGRLVAPQSGVIKGLSVLASTGIEGSEQAILRGDVAQHLKLGVPRSRSRSGYPNSPMGAVALARQAFLDADWHARAWAAHDANGQLPRPERNDALTALREALHGQQLVILDAPNELYFLRADSFAREFSLNALIRGSGQEYQRLDAIRATGRPVIVPVNFPRPPTVNSPESARNVELSELLHWDHAPENPARLAQAGVRIAFTSDGLRALDDYLAQIRIAVSRGLSADAALHALTLAPAELLGIDQRLGSLAPGKLASFVVTNGDLFDKQTKVESTWIAGRRYEIQKPQPADVRGTWEGKLVIAGKTQSFTATLEGTPEKLAGTMTRAGEKSAKPIKLANLAIRDQTLSGTFAAADWEPEKTGKAQFSAILLAPPDEPWTLSGTLVWPDGQRWNWSAMRTEKPSVDQHEPKPAGSDTPKPDRGSADGAASDQEGGRPDDAQDAQASGADARQGKQAVAPEASDQKRTKEGGEKTKAANAGKKKKAKKKKSLPATPPGLAGERPKKPEDQPGDQPATQPGKESDTADEQDSAEKKPVATSVRASFPVNYPLGAFGRTTLADRPRHVLFKNATIWTAGPEGTLQNASLLVTDGKIAAVGADVTAPPDAVIVDAKGKHLSPGIIDCHSHMATDGGVNEGTQAITAEVRVGDFIDCNDIDIYRQLAGGVTTANILHGSANPIGGQNQVIKLRWGELSDALRFAEAPPGIKFALGENVKRSNFTQESTRYPQSRMGVEQLIRDAFQAAREYGEQWRRWEKHHDTLPPRRDLELETLHEILEGKRWVHCHSYRQDEILALLRTCEEFGIRIATLQHILEGYKVADAIARHGAMGSSFSDWWAYKIEVYDAIPYNGALMHRAGVVVSFNSDDRELARHLNHEAAKATKYGEIAPEEALQFVTLNPARQLRIDQCVGSLEVGKHADLVVWSGPPLALTSRCEQTWIDGRKFFDREEDLQLREKARTMHAELVQKILASGETSRNAEEGQKPDEELWPREDIYCRARVR